MMPIFDILRISDGAYGAFGVMMHEGVPFVVTLEPPWKGNYPFESCIPANDYKCRRIKSPKFGETFEVVDVQDRTMVLFHKGNISKDTEGCILVGEEFGMVSNVPGVASSGKGFNEFMERLSGCNEFWLRIKWRN